MSKLIAVKWFEDIEITDLLRPYKSNKHYICIKLNSCSTLYSRSFIFLPKVVGDYALTTFNKDSELNLSQKPCNVNRNVLCL